MIRCPPGGPGRRRRLQPHAATTIWAAAVAAPDFLKSEETERDFLEPKLLAAGSITQCFSPRGLGKTHVAHALQVKHAVAGKRVLLIDRDNSRREVKRRLRTWGADAARTLKVLTRENAPALTDRAAWAAFPFTEYDLITIDSIDSATEGVGEGDSAKPSKALASILDIAHREAGPAILVLGNTIKSAAHSRGSGVVEDRADIVFEVRDATDLRPTGTKDWWHELPPAGVDAWAQRASRRKKREVYRLAFIASKFRIGEEPDPFCFEVDLRTEPWAQAEGRPRAHRGERGAALEARASARKGRPQGLPPMLTLVSLVTRRSKWVGVNRRSRRGAEKAPFTPPAWILGGGNATPLGPALIAGIRERVFTPPPPPRHGGCGHGGRTGAAR